MDKIYQLLQTVFLSQLRIILINLLRIASAKNFIESSLLSLNTQPAIFLKKFNNQFYCMQTKGCL